MPKNSRHKIGEINLVMQVSAVICKMMLSSLGFCSHQQIPCMTHWQRGGSIDAAVGHSIVVYLG